MKNCIQLVTVFAVMFWISACKNQQKVAENQPVNSVQAPAPAPVSNEKSVPQQSDNVPPSTTDQKPAQPNTQMVSGREIIDILVKKLNNNLKLSDDQKGNITSYLSEAFTASGESLDKMYPRESAKDYGSRTIKSAADPIRGVLKENQKAEFERFLQH